MRKLFQIGSSLQAQGIVLGNKAVGLPKSLRFITLQRVGEGE